uniref:Uncharacterized protein n=1 Tax=Romanomermis culicivorax TaxID=13658 RepID=A0A915L583_ROMCU
EPGHIGPVGSINPFFRPKLDPVHSVLGQLVVRYATAQSSRFGRQFHSRRRLHVQPFLVRPECRLRAKSLHLPVKFLRRRSFMLPLSTKLQFG